MEITFHDVKLRLRSNKIRSKWLVRTQGRKIIAHVTSDSREKSMRHTRVKRVGPSRAEQRDEKAFSVQQELEKIAEDFVR